MRANRGADLRLDQGRLPQIGQALNRDHTTALHGIERIATQFETDETLRREITAIRERLYRAAL